MGTTTDRLGDATKHLRRFQGHAPSPWTYHIGIDYTEFYDANGEPFLFARHLVDEPTARLIAEAPAIRDQLADAYRALSGEIDAAPKGGTS